MEERREAAVQIRDQIRVLREQKWLILLCIALAAAAAGVYTTQKDKVYESQAKVLIRQENLGPGLTGLPAPTTSDPTRETATNRELVALPQIATGVTERLKGRVAGVNLLDRVKTTSEADSNVIKIVVEDSDPNRAADIANAFAGEFIEFRREANRERLTEGLEQLERRIKRLGRSSANRLERERLRDQASEVRLLASLQTGDAQLVQLGGTPSDPIEPKPVRNLLLGLLFGALLGIALAFLRDRLDRRVKTEDDVRALLPGVPVVGSIPRAGRGRRSRDVLAERFRSLQTNLRLITPGGAPRSILVTSAAGGEGKSTTVVNLALAMHEQHRRAVIVEADLRRPELSQRLSVNGAHGVSMILAGEESIESSVKTTNVEASTKGRGPKLVLAGEVTVVPAGPQPPNPPALLADRRLDALLQEVGADRGTVLIDGPPLGLFSDMLPVARKVGGVLVVVRLNHSRRDGVEDLVEQLDHAGVKPLGIVVIGVPVEGSDYYRYRYRPRRERSRPT